MTRPIAATFLRLNRPDLMTLSRPASVRMRTSREALSSVRCFRSAIRLNEIASDPLPRNGTILQPASTESARQ